MKITNPMFLQSAGNAGGTFVPYVKMKSAANKLGVVIVSCEGEISVEYQDNGIKKTDVYTDLEEVNLYIRADKNTYATIKGSLTYLDCSGNQLTALDVSGLNSLTYLDCYGNQLTALDVSGLNSLTYLYCYGNQLTALDVSGLNSLQTLYCYGNQFLSDSESATTFADSLYEVEEGKFASMMINGTQAETIQTAAEEKGWTVTVI